MRSSSETSRLCWFTNILAGAALWLAAAAIGTAEAAPPCDADAVAAAGAAIAAACPCAGTTSPSGEVVPWKNHGQYVSCVTHERNQIAKDLDLSKSCLRQATRCGARSTCGKPGFVTCR